VPRIPRMLLTIRGRPLDVSRGMKDRPFNARRRI
jgi:hypothetical protein